MTTAVVLPELNACWIPFTPSRPLKATPRMVVSAQGIACRTVDGREVLCSTSGS